MNQRSARLLLYLALFVLYLLHNDLWLWNNPGLVLGIPAGLFYHVMFCIAASVLMALVVSNAWPRHLKGSIREGESG